MPSNKEQSTEPKIDWVESKHGVFPFYANNVNLLWTPHDVRVKFGELVKVTEATEDAPRVFTIEERVNVMMSWTEAKALQMMLADLVTRFEKLNGEITIPKIP
jgi:Protein of unknown function (DUF3467)